MKIQNDKELKIKLKGDDVDDFKTAIKKIAAENKTTGFNRSNLTVKEIECIKSLSDKL